MNVNISPQHAIKVDHGSQGYFVPVHGMPWAYGQGFGMRVVMCFHPLGELLVIHIARHFRILRGTIATT